MKYCRIVVAEEQRRLIHWRQSESVGRCEGKEGEKWQQRPKSGVDCKGGGWLGSDIHKRQLQRPGGGFERRNDHFWTEGWYIIFTNHH